jgi:hypothetical protein
LKKKPGFRNMKHEPNKEPEYCRVLRTESKNSQVWWLMPVILASREAEIRRIEVQSQPRQIVQETLSLKKSITKKGWRSSSSGRAPV